MSEIQEESKPKKRVVAVVGDAVISQLYTEILFPCHKRGVPYDLDFSLENCLVQWFPNPILKLSDVKNLSTDLMSCGAEIVIMHVGGNDLSPCTLSYPSLASEIIKVAQEVSMLSNEGGAVRLVCITQIRPRYCPVSQWEDFNLIAEKAHKQISNAMQGRPDISVEDLLPFCPNNSGGGMESCINAQDILDDGIHLGSKGLHHLYQSLQKLTEQSITLLEEEDLREPESAVTKKMKKFVK